MDDALYSESGSSWWPVLWGPLFALAGYGIELLTGPANGFLWSLVGIALAMAAALWVHGRRRIGAVRVTVEELHQGRERLAVEKIAEIDDVGLPTGAKVLGGGWTAPRGTTGLPIRLRDGSVVLGWARDVEALQQALRRVLPS